MSRRGAQRRRGCPPRWPRAPAAGLLPRPAYEDQTEIWAVGDLVRAVQTLPALPLAAAGCPWASLLSLHDRLQAGRPAAGGPRARLASRAGLGARAVAGHIWGPGDDGGHGIELWLVFAGRFWWPRAPLAAPGLADFLAWDRPMTTRVAWRLSLAGAPGPGRRVALALTLRAAHVDGWARLAFSAYMAAVGRVSRALRRRLLVGLARGAGLAMPGGIVRCLAGPGAMAPW